MYIYTCIHTCVHTCVHSVHTYSTFVYDVSQSYLYINIYFSFIFIFTYFYSGWARTALRPKEGAGRQEQLGVHVPVGQPRPFHPGHHWVRWSPLSVIRSYPRLSRQLKGQSHEILRPPPPHFLQCIGSGNDYLYRIWKFSNGSGFHMTRLFLFKKVLVPGNMI
jgi:hypothetical protein